MWSAVTSEWELTAHERFKLVQACRQADLVAGLESQIRNDGYVLPWGQSGQRSHPLLARLEGARGLLARLQAGLRVPEDDGLEAVAEAPQRQGRRFRGNYGPRAS